MQVGLLGENLFSRDYEEWDKNGDVRKYRYSHRYKYRYKYGHRHNIFKK